MHFVLERAHLHSVHSHQIQKNMYPVPGKNMYRVRRVPGNNHIPGTRYSDEYESSVG